MKRWCTCILILTGLVMMMMMMEQHVAGETGERESETRRVGNWEGRCGVDSQGTRAALTEAPWHSGRLIYYLAR